MIGPTSETGRAMMSSLQQAMSKGMPVDQAIAHVKSMARDGIAPLVDLYALMKQFERMKQVPVQPLQTPNIRQQLSGLEAAMQQRQATPMQNPQAMMGRGLGGLNAGAMENPSFAGGGIVAFDEGGPARTTAPQLYSDIPKFDTYEQMRAANIARLGQDPTQFEESEAERIRKANEARGLGEFAPSMTMREKLLAEDKAAAERVGEEEASLDRDEFWADVGTNAAERGATFLSSLAKAQKGKASRKRATAEKVKKATRDVKLAEIALTQVKELEKAGRYKEAAELRKTIYDDIEKASAKIADATAAETAAEAAHNRAVKLKQTEGPIDALERERRKLGKLKPGTPEFDEQSEKIDAMSMTPGRMPSQYSSTLAAARKAVTEAKRLAVDALGAPIPNDPRVKAAEAELKRVENYIISRGYDLPGVSPMGAPAAGGIKCNEADIIAGVPGCV